MFSFLVFIGLVLIFLGVYLNNDKSNHDFLESKDINQETHKLDDIINRIENLEYEFKNKKTNISREVKFIDILESAETQQEEYELIVDVKTKAKEFEVLEDNQKAFKAISLMDEGKYSLEEVCKILNMKKGEVLLLRNLYKKYPE